MSDPRVKQFYEARGWAAAWSDGLAARLEEGLAGAERHGLDSRRFRDLVSRSEDPAQREASLTLAALFYAEALASGVVDPSEVYAIYEIPRNRVDVAAGLNAALKAGNLDQWFESLAPSDPEYRALSAAYVRYRSQVGQPARAQIPSGKLVRPGQADERLPAVSDALRELGYLGPAEQQPPVRLDATLAGALKRLQADIGLKSDGVLGAETLKALNTGPADRARQLALNLERRRWLVRQPAATRIEVNTAANQLVFYRDGAPAWSSRVISGLPDKPTPNLAAPFDQLVVNPPWRVPKSIAEAEILPKGPAYLAANDMYVDGDGQVVQRAGPKSALGLVKFDMQDKHAIYLHDTPAKSHFAESERHLSHGCVRVENAVEFARMLATAAGKGAEFDDALASGESRSVKLGADVPVRLLYHTAYLAPDGRIAFAHDQYGWDNDLARALGMPPVATSVRTAAAGLATSLGP